MPLKGAILELFVGMCLKIEIYDCMNVENSIIFQFTLSFSLQDMNF